MGMAKKVRMLLIERGVTLKDLAERLGTSGNNLSGKLSRDNLSEKELIEIANALDCDFDASFVLRESGKRI